MTRSRLLLVLLMAGACAGLCGCGTMNLFGDKAAGEPASLGASLRIPLGSGGAQAPGPGGGN